MMEDADFDNELSEDDEDFVPTQDVIDDSVSENSGADEDEPADSDNDGEPSKPKKRKKVTKSRRSRRTEAEPVEEEHQEELEVTTEEKKRRADELWADFLNDTDNSPQPKPQPASSSTGKSETSSPATSKPAPASLKPSIPVASANIFEFAGETFEVPTKSSDPPKAVSENPTKPIIQGVKRPSGGGGGGLASMLNQLNKKNKLSVLEKTKLDWDGFKSNEGISEELQTHNRGRDGFLERKDFLERTDLKQFEIEKNLRLTRRK